MATDPKLDDFLGRSKIIFIGTVQKLGSNTISGLAPTSSSVVIKVDESLRMPKSLGNLKGHLVTVELAGPPGLRAGEQAIFFTVGSVYADTIQVKEIGRLPVDKSAGGKNKQVAAISEAAKLLPQKLMKSRLAAADVVVTGRVTSIRPALLEPRRSITRNNPNWQEAVIDVESVELGSLTVKQVVVVFPKSRYVLWRDSPKFTVGQEYVLVLRKHNVKQVRTPGYRAAGLLDAHPKKRRDEIRAMIKR